MKIGTVVSARTASTRLPRKALRELGGVPMIQFLIERIVATRLGGRVVFATTQREDDDELSRTVTALGIPVFRGADDDVVRRHLDAALAFGLDWVVRITGDCPFVDANSLDDCLGQWDGDLSADLWTTKGVFPVGIDFELFCVATVARQWPDMSAAEREHLTLRLYRPEASARLRRFVRPKSWPATEKTFTVDTERDYVAARRLVERLGTRTFSIDNLLAVATGMPCAE